MTSGSHNTNFTVLPIINTNKKYFVGFKGCGHNCDFCNVMLLQGHRAFTGHKKYITPNKRHMLPYFLNSSLSEEEFNMIIKELHQDSLGKPELRTNKIRRDVTKYPVPECMCNDSHVQS